MIKESGFLEASGPHTTSKNGIKNSHTHAHTCRDTHYRTFAHTLTLTSLSMLNSCVRASKVFTFRFINIFAAVRLPIFSFIVNCGVNVNQNSLPFTAKTKQTAGCQVDRRGKRKSTVTMFWGIVVSSLLPIESHSFASAHALSPFRSLTMYFSIRCR